jgi:hypothetical protein
MIEKTISDMAKGAPLMPDDYRPAMAKQGCKLIAHPLGQPRYMIQTIVEALSSGQAAALKREAVTIDSALWAEGRLRLRRVCWVIQCALEAGRQAELDAAFGPEMADAPAHDWSDSDFFVRV